LLEKKVSYAPTYEIGLIARFTQFVDDIMCLRINLIDPDFVFF
jgi:hypothetical protein